MKLRSVARICISLCVLSLVPLAGCGSGGSLLTSTAATTGAASSVYVTQAPTLGAGVVLRFAASASGSVQPAATLDLPTDLILVQSIAVNPSGQVYVGGRNYNVVSEIEEYAAGASGSATPVRTLTLGPTSFANLGAMTFDAAGNLYAGADDVIAVFSAAGSTAPVRVISGPLTQLIEVDGIAVDAQGTVYVTNGLTGIGSVLVFSPGATGNVAPARTITGVGSSSLYDPSGIAIDGDDNLFVSGFVAATGAPSIFEFAPGASGFATPMKTISGAATGFGGLAGIGSLRIDGAGNLYVLVLTPVTTAAGTTYQPSVLTFAADASGNVAPVSSFSSAAWTTAAYGQFGLD